MKNSEFLIASKTKDLIYRLIACTENIPRNDFFYKNEIYITSFNIYRKIMEVNFSEELEEKFKLKAKIKANFSYLDLLLESIFKKKYINVKALEKINYKITEIQKMLSKWFDVVLK